MNTTVSFGEVEKAEPILYVIPFSNDSEHHRCLTAFDNRVLTIVVETMQGKGNWQ